CVIDGAEESPQDNLRVQRSISQCLAVLDQGRSAFVGEVNAADESLYAQENYDRSVLLKQKQALGFRMEELRATMRRVQEDGELCITAAREEAALHSLDLVLAAGQRDELTVLKQQLARSRQQNSEHLQAEQELRAELARTSATFQDAVAVPTWFAAITF
ncbi:unnamed protein product, partial [Polarella glacialis]